MGTRSTIVGKLSNSKWASIYCHWDGYVEHNGRILFEHYTGQKKIEALLALGDLSSLGPNLGRKHSFDAPTYGTKAYERWMAQQNTRCTAYGRDRGETDVSAQIGDTLAEVMPEVGTWSEFVYVWDGEKWLVGDPEEGTQALRDLGEVLTGAASVTPPVKAFGATIGRHVKHNPANPTQHKWAKT